MNIFFGVRRYFSNWWQTTSLLQEPDATAILQSWHIFDQGKQRWTEIVFDNSGSSAVTVANHPGPGSGRNETSDLILWTWNVDAFAKNPEARMSGIIAAIQNHALPPDVLFFQEVSRAALDFLLAHTWTRENCYSSEADATNWTKQQFGTITLVSKRSFDHESGRGASKSRIGLVWRVQYPSRFGRDALCCEVFLRPAGVPVRLINVHLDSLPIQPSFRPRQLAIVAGMLHSRGRGVVAGDFNPVLPGDDAIVAENRLVDAWAELHPGEDGYTWGIDRQQQFPPGRLDKIATVGLRAKVIEVIHPGVLAESEIGGEAGEGHLRSGEGEENDHKASESIPWSDHSGLRCTFGLVDIEPP